MPYILYIFLSILSYTMLNNVFMLHKAWRLNINNLTYFV